VSDQFVVARNPDPDSSLPFLVSLPIDGGIFLKTRESWPRTNRSYCHPVDDWPADAEVVERVSVSLCRRRGSAIDLVLDRRMNSRSQFVFTTSKGREIILWQTSKVTRKARPGARVPKRRAAGLTDWQIVVDTRERYPYRFANRSVTTERAALPVGGYAVKSGETVIASVERKTLENLSADLISGKLTFTMAELSTLPAAAVVVEDRYTALFKMERVEPGWLAELVARVQVRFPNVPIVFCDNRKFAEEGPFDSWVRLSPSWARPRPSVVFVGIDVEGPVLPANLDPCLDIVAVELNADPGRAGVVDLDGESRCRGRRLELDLAGPVADDHGSSYRVNCLHTPLCRCRRGRAGCRAGAG